MNNSNSVVVITSLIEIQMSKGGYNQKTRLVYFELFHVMGTVMNKIKQQHLLRQINITLTASVAELLRAWDTLTMFEATVCGRS